MYLRRRIESTMSSVSVRESFDTPSAAALGYSIGMK